MRMLRGIALLRCRGKMFIEENGRENDYGE
jgi:hypothetical protein